MENDVLNAQQEREIESAKKLELELLHTSEKRDSKIRLAMQKTRGSTTDLDQLLQDTYTIYFKDQVCINQEVSLRAIKLVSPESSKISVFFFKNV